MEVFKTIWSFHYAIIRYACEIKTNEQGIKSAQLKEIKIKGKIDLNLFKPVLIALKTKTN